jgi:hypothetical protein
MWHARDRTQPDHRRYEAPIAGGLYPPATFFPPGRRRRLRERVIRGEVTRSRPARSARTRMASSGTTPASGRMAFERSGMRNSSRGLRTFFLGFLALAGLGSLGCMNSGSLQMGGVFRGGGGGCRTVCGHWVRCRTARPPRRPPRRPVCRTRCLHRPRCLPPPPVSWAPPRKALPRWAPPPRRALPPRVSLPLPPPPRRPRPLYPPPKGKPPGLRVPPRTTTRTRPPPTWTGDKGGQWRPLPRRKSTGDGALFGLVD